MVGLALKLTSLGFSKGAIVETIVSTYNMDGSANAAPMGVILKDDSHLIITFFKSSKTYKNITENRCAVINLTNSIEAFYKTAFKEANPKGKLSREWFKKARLVEAPKISFADATVEVSLDSLEANGDEKTQAVFSVRSIEATKIYPQAICRAASLTLEAIIHATRVKAYFNIDSEQAEVNKLLETINWHSEVVNRVAPNSIYQLVMVDLQKRISSWRNTS
jgi:uncharacterized protein